MVQSFESSRPVLAVEFGRIVFQRPHMICYSLELAQNYSYHYFNGQINNRRLIERQEGYSRILAQGSKRGGR